MKSQSFFTTLKPVLAVAALAVALPMVAQSAKESVPDGPIPLETFRSMALENNKKLMMSRERLKGAEYTKKEAFAAYLPGIDFAGGYTYNQRELSLISEDQMLPTKSFNLQTGKYEYNLVIDPRTGMPIKGPNGQYVPSTVAIIPKEAMTFDIHNVFFGAVTLTQPIYMGGKIVALNEMARAGVNAAREMQNLEAQNVVYAVDAAYWQVVSLKAKYRLATSYVALLDSLYNDVNKMYAAGVATKSDILSVEVKRNSAQIDLTKVENGLVLSRMALAQVCGIPVNTPLVLADEDNTTAVPAEGVSPEGGYNMEDVYSRRADLRALGQAVEAAKFQKRVVLSDMLPNVALVGAYSVSNPNMYDGFEKKFKGAFSVGAMVKIPLWHWGGHLNKYKAAETAETVRRLELQDAKEMVSLQVSQASFKTQEAYKTYAMTTNNLRKADDNLRNAKLAFSEGMGTTDNVMAAQTAWLKAHSEQIDALIDVQLCQVYLSKALGTLTTNNSTNE